MNPYHNYIFLSEINDELSTKIKKIKKVSIIYYIDDFQLFSENNCKRIRNFCKNIKAPFYLVNSVKNAVTILQNVRVMYVCLFELISIWIR
jgi:hypothetical protein